MNNPSIVQLKFKANQFIQEYEKQQTEREYQKQRLKQTIMLDILSNRNKTQSSVSNGRDSKIQENSFTREAMKKKVQLKREDAPYSEFRQPNKSEVVNNRSNSLSMGYNEAGNMIAEITFKANKNQTNNMLIKQPFRREQQQYSKSFQNSMNQPEQQQKEQDSNIPEENQQMTFRTQEPQQFGNTSENRRSQIAKSQKFKFLQPEIKPNSDQEEEINFRDNKYSDLYRKKVEKEKESYMMESRQNQAAEDDQQIQEEKDNQKGVFLTMDENESMEITQEIGHKNYAFDIMMEKSEPIDNLQELRKKKIQELDKKRQLRLSEHKRSEMQKKSDLSANKNSQITNNSRKSQNKISEDPEPQPPKYSLNRKKNMQPQKKTNLSANNIQQSAYNFNNPSSTSIKRSYNYVPQQQKYEHDYGNECLRTPASIASEARTNKSRNKNTIFRQSPRRAQKSASKYSQDPKIEPKQRKNTFVKQSNKKLMINAVTHVCLPGQLNRKDRQKFIEVIENQPAEFFVFLFKQYSRKVIKAIYVLDHSQSILQKIYGQKAPQEISSQNVTTFYRFDSGSREFKKLDGCKSFSLVVHAIDLR